MTKEELEKEAEEWIVEYTGIDVETQRAIRLQYHDNLRNAYLASAEPREKQIQIDAEQIRALQKQNGELTDKLTEAKEIIKELLNSCFGYNSKTVNYEVKAEAEQFLKDNA